MNVTELLYVVPAALAAIIGHEFAHGYVSYKMGDPTPKRDGRLSLNPLKHLDPLGTLCLILFHFGWAKPVQINMAYYENKRKGVLLTALAGPAMNFIMALIAYLITGVIVKMTGGLIPTPVFIFAQWLEYFAAMNIGLGVFNLIPIPPLDGSKALGMILHNDPESIAGRIHRQGYFVLAILAITGILSIPMNLARTAVSTGMITIVRFILRL